MLTTAYYFLQVVLCSGVMIGYYWLVLRNKRFHQYNRFYLLAIAAFSWIVPLIKIKWGHTVISEDPQMIRFLSVVADNNSQMEESLSGKGFQWSWDMLAPGIYMAVALVLLFGMLRALFRIYRLLQIHSGKNVGDVYLIITEAKGTPFSFFRYIFWNDEIDIRSEAGKQILQHELTHVQQKHSFDKLYIQVMLIGGWFNPFFWLVRKEMDMIHEFIADNKAVANGDTASLAQMLLTAAYPQQKFLLTHTFFFSPIKRRLQMLANKRSPRFSYLRRLVVLPLLAIVIVLFAFRNKDQKTANTISVATLMGKVADQISDLEGGKKSSIEVFDMAILDRTYTVVIDAGHGGKDKGNIAADGTTEAALNLQLAKTIRDLNNNDKIHIILRREADVFQDAGRITETVNQQTPDMYISLHVNGSSPVITANGNSRANPATGMEIFVPSKSKAADYDGSMALANYINTSLVSMKEKMLGIKSREKGIVVLDNVKSAAVLIETGFLSYEADLKKLKDVNYQKQMANAVLQGINTYLSRPIQNKLNLAKLGMDTIIIKQKEKKNETKFSYTPNLESLNEKAPLYFVDGKKMDKSVIESLSPNLIYSIDILKEESAKARYGDEGKNGVVLITTKDYNKKKPLWMVDGKKIDDYAWNTLPSDKIDKIVILKDSNTIKLYGEEAKNGVVIISTKKNNYDRQEDQTFFNGISRGKDSANWRINGKIIGLTYKNKNVSSSKNPDSLIWVGQNQDEILVSNQPLFIVDGERPILKNGRIPTSDIMAVNVLKGKSAIDKYGKNAKNGVVEIITKKNKTVIGENTRLENSPNDQVVNKILIPAEFPGSQTSWLKYLERNLNRDLPKKNGAPDGSYTVVIIFKIDRTGKISDINAANDPGYGTKEEAIRVIEKGPRWKPAVQNGMNVDYEKKQSITFVVSGGTPAEKNAAENNNHVFTQTQIPAEFPGGQLSWQKYLERNLNREIIVEKGGPPGKYTVIVSFKVDKTGSVSDVKAENNPGYGTKEEAIRLIVKGPRWKPAMQNGETVNSVRKQPVTWVVPENPHLPR